ncbi:MAG: CBS domain-containing protein [Phenylobacterium sp.]|uniref:CBS domain-containing protein n=1 Tax=Phenylobacterium sp. TaxID=1871053 RepID=UPI002732F992|nr:CBS domain-containing protein [Phenylobacterium sp.]MDP3173317.1 CBS domain-containing protein [Phenylobacterium sp.]
MSQDVVSTTPEESIEQVARQMAERDVGSLPVLDGGRLIGMVTDRDIVVRGLAQGLYADAKVQDVMTADVESVFESDDVEDVHDRMSAAQIRRLPVVTEDGELVGIVALADLARLDTDEESGATLEEISEPSTGEHRSFAP